MQFRTIVLLSTVVAAAWALSCYQCNTGANGEEVCDSTEVTDLAKWKKGKAIIGILRSISPCGKLADGPFANKNAIGCRKIEQYVEDKKQTIRECAYSGEEVDGLKKTGNNRIQLYFYQCNNKDGCNAGTSASVLAAFASVVAVFAFRY
ncbi:unnamed protein product, partial [Mesorhabditis spiculigera]